MFLQAVVVTGLFIMSIMCVCVCMCVRVYVCVLQVVQIAHIGLAYFLSGQFSNFNYVSFAVARKINVVDE